jgi:VanZ family protein
MNPRAPSQLPHFLVALYGFAIVYASLSPFAPWIAPSPGTPFFLFAPWPPRGARFDVLANIVAYLPFGFLVALVPRRRPPLGRFSVAVAAGLGLSFAMESLQMFIPPRVASVGDLLANGAGTVAGAALAVVFARSEAAKRGATSLRERWFVGGRFGDLGLALIAVWLAAQVNPGIPLFAIVFDPVAEFGVAASAPPIAEWDRAAALVEGAHSALQLLGVGLFLTLLVRERRYAGGAVLLLLGAALAAKGVAAMFLLKPAVWQHWLSPGVFFGIAAGALFLLAAIALPRPAQIALATIALLSSLLTTLLAPDLLFARPPLSMFSWAYGHLLNFNGLTHAVLLAWPIVASAYLFVLAGRPDWGRG